jgi:hypothetical protein
MRTCNSPEANPYSIMRTRLIARTGVKTLFHKGKSIKFQFNNTKKRMIQTIYVKNYGAL